MDMFHSPSVSFAVEKIIDVITVEGNIKNFKVQWAPTWVSSLNLVGCEKLIKQFLSQRFVEYKCLDGIVKVPVDFTVEKDIPLATGRDDLINREESIREVQASSMKKVDGITRKIFSQRKETNSLEQEGGANIIEGETSIRISNVHRVNTENFQDFSERKDINPTNIMEQGTSATFTNSLLQERQNPSVQNVEFSVETTDITTSTFDENVEVDKDSQQAHQEFKQDLVSATALATLPLQVDLPNGIKSSNVDNEGSLGEEYFEIDKCIKLEDVENLKCNESLTGQSSQAADNDAEGRINQRYMQNIAIETVETSEVIHSINENENELAQCIRLEDEVNSFDQTVTNILHNCSDGSHTIQDMGEDGVSPGVAMSMLENLSHISAGSIVDSKFALQSVQNIKSEEVASSNQCSSKSKLKLSAVTRSNNPSVLRRNSLKRSSEKMATENQILQYPKKQKKTPQKKECPSQQQKFNTTKINSQIDAPCIKNEFVFGKHKVMHKSCAENNSNDTETFDLKCKRCGMSYEQKLSFDKHKCFYKCGTCLQVFSSKYKFTRHNTSHSSQRNFKCGVCSQTYKTKDNLGQHMLTHGPKFQCTTCFKTFSRKYRINKHSCIISSKRKGKKEN